MQQFVVVAFTVASEGYQALCELRQKPETDTYRLIEAALVRKDGDGVTVLDATDGCAIGTAILDAYATSGETRLVARVEESEPCALDAALGALSCTIERHDLREVEAEARRQDKHARHMASLKRGIGRLRQGSAHAMERLDKFADEADALYTKASTRLSDDLDAIAAAIDAHDEQDG